MERVIIRNLRTRFLDKFITTYADTGKAVLPFCLGPSDKCNKDPVRAIYGSVQLKSDPYCDGVIIPATIPELTLGSVLYNIAGKNEDVLKFLGPLKSAGIKDATLELVAGKYGVELNARGSPMVATDASNVFLKFIQKYYDTIVYQVTAKVEAQGGFTFESRAGRGPITFPGGVFKISDVRGNLGPSTFTRYSFLPIGGTSQDFGITLPLLICVDDCGTASETILAFQGELYFSVEAPNGAPPSMLVNGDLKMDGWWYNVLKAPFAHMGNVQLGIGFDMKVGIFPPTRIEAGGQICFDLKTLAKDWAQMTTTSTVLHTSAFRRVIQLTTISWA